METDVKVFHSEISRVDCEEESHLYSLLKIEPAEPISQCSPCTKNEAWEFKPKEKLYSPKRVQSHLKVKTVSDVRALFEKDLYINLTSDLAIQQNYLLRKICDGSSSEENTRNTAIRVLNSHKPISRSSWQMISNINPERQIHSKQYVLWNGACIQVNGSKGGKNKFICNHDLKNIVRKSIRNFPNFKKPVLKSKIGLLRNSLNVKFKPGPLQKKKFLDASHHKYQMGNIQVVKLPTPVLEVSPTYGTILESTISSFVNSLRGVEGVITEKLAEFAVSVLGTVHDNTVTQTDENCFITFNLNYMCEQSRMLMRRDIVETTPYTNIKNANSETKSVHIGSKTNTNVNFRVPLEDECTETVSNDSFVEIKQIMNEILDSVDISLNQDSRYFKEDPNPRDIMADDAKDLITSKDKSKRKYCELGKLDVTVINLPENSNTDYTKPCGKSFCTMGCVCESLDCVFNLKQHCGVLSCMFGCKCEVSKYKNIGLLEDDCSDIIPGLLNLDNEINSRLAKEEQKFHQTVIFSGEKSIILKSRKRSCKSSKKYAEFFSKINLKGDEKIKKILTVDIERLSCENIEPWCMVHNLYKCFCEGKFIESYMRQDETTKIQHEINTTTSISESTKEHPDSCELSVLRPRLRKTYGNPRIDVVLKHSPQTDVVDDDELSVACARTIGYHGRKYIKDYYIATNSKIAEMEKNDITLKKKLLRLINGKNISSKCQITDISSESLNGESSPNESEENVYDSDDKFVNKNEDESKDIPNKTASRKSELPNKTANRKEEINFANAEHKGSLKNWLESSYKTYKERLLKGLLKNCLEAPKKGKAVLQSWDFILSRYRERKNIFVVSKQEPFRTFLAVDNSHPLLANCINIDDIRFADLPKYPMIVRNLVTNATDAENVFCILRGWDHCWELIGSAVKVIEQSGSLTDDMNIFDTHDLTNKDYLSDNGNDDSFDRNCERMPEKVQETNVWNEAEHDTEPRYSKASEKSKWFELTIENDFTEIQFYKKGFYVTYEGIQRSINLARISGKTVRLSSRARTDDMQSTSQPYGIYAIPCTSQSRVFIGPYEVDEPLGIEVVKTVLDSRRQKKTRGVWITTNKLDDKNVIDNPLAYLPSATKEIQGENIPVVNSGIVSSPKLPTENEGENVTNITPEIDTSILKQIKPIKIRRTNGFYHFSSNNVLQKIARPDLSTNKNINEMPKISDDSKETSKLSCISKEQSIQEFVPRKKYAAESRPSTSYIKPVAEIAPQIKITHVYSEESLQNKVASKKKGGAMHILKPEEINKTVELAGLNDDIEKFLMTSTICIAPQEEILVISDGEDDEVTPCNDVWVQCCNVQNFGYLRAKIKNDDNDTRISFEFPGFKYSEFYKEDEAFEKINQVLARKMYIPKNKKLHWQVIPQEQSLTSKMLTPECLADKKYLLTKLREQQDKKKSMLKAFTSTTLKKIFRETPNTFGKTPKSRVATKRMKKKTILPEIDVAVVDTTNTKNEQMKFIQGLEDKSRKLEKESAVLWNEAVTRRDEIFGSLVVPDNLKLGMTEALQDIMSLNE